MKSKIVLFLILALIIANVKAQTNNDEAIATYQIAQAEFEQSNFKDALVYLNKVDVLNPDAKTKTSYIKAKCYNSLLSGDVGNADDDLLYFNCINSIKYYIDNGKDDDKKAELLKIKIKIENSVGYKDYRNRFQKSEILKKKFENMSDSDALHVIKNIMAQNPRSEQDGGSSYGNTQYWNTLIWFSKDCILKIVHKSFETSNSISGAGCCSGDIYIYTISLSGIYLKDTASGYFGKNNNDAIHVTKGDYIVWSKNRFDRQSESDIQNIKEGTDKNRTYDGYKNEAVDYFSIRELVKWPISHEDKINLEMALNVLIKNCGGAVKDNTLNSTNASEAEGDSINGKKDGHGTFVWPDGKIYDGAWKDGLENGMGTMTFEDGRKYIGEWKDNQEDGQGTMTYLNGNKYEGEWKNGKSNGKGTLTFSDGTKQKGEWKNDTATGHCTLIYPNGVNEIDENIVNGNYDGIITYYYKNGALWIKAEFKNGKVWNTITQNLPDGRPGLSNVKEGNGKLIYYYEDGKIKSDENLKNGNLDGECKYYKNGVLMTDFIYQDGKLWNTITDKMPDGSPTGSNVKEGNGVTYEQNEAGITFQKTTYVDGVAVKTEAVLK